ncbi:hypothetical protein LCGC14_2852730, partial [marine sediment metagenome]
VCKDLMNSPPPAVQPARNVRFDPPSRTWQRYGGGGVWIEFLCPYGVPGDRLWVRETHGIIQPTHATPGGKPYDQGPVYRADGDEAPTWDEGPFEFSGWRSSIHMPRWASRLTLEVTDVYVKQLQNMGKYDAQAEGFWPNGHVQDTDGCDVWCPKASAEEAKSQFIDYWDSRYDKQGFGWNANPWVFVVNFKDITKEK